MNCKTLTIIILAIATLATASCRHKMEISVDSPATGAADSVATPVLEVFIENSGSMDGYMAEGSTLRDAVFDYVSDLATGCDTTRLFYINSAVIPFKGSLNNLIATLNPATFSAAGGNRANSDLATMLETIVPRANDSTVVMFVSDCILDLPAANSAKWLENCRIRLRNAFAGGRASLKGMGVEILKMKSTFSGCYYYPDGSSTTLSGVERPYYIWIIGDSHLIAALNRRVPLTGLDKLGLQQMVAFSGARTIEARASNSTMTGSTVNAARGVYNFTVMADLGPTLQPDSVLSAPATFTLSSPAAMIDGVYRVKNADEPGTHFIRATLPASTKVNHLTLSMAPRPLPDWVAKSDDSTGTRIETALDKTTGIGAIIRGVHDAFTRDPAVATISLKIDNR